MTDRASASPRVAAATAAPLRIALVRARYNPYGGAERFAERALAALGALRGGGEAGEGTSSGVQISVIARRWDGQALPPNVTWLRCDPFYLGKVWRERSFARAVLARVSAENFDLVQSHERIPGLPVYRAGDGVHAAWLLRRGVTLNRWQRLGVALNPLHRYLLATERAMFEHPALRAVICNSRMVRDEIAVRFAIDPARLHVIPNGIDLDVHHPGVVAHRAALRAQLGIDDRAPVFLSVGSGYARKGVAVALAALARVPGAARLVVVGDDRHAGRYRRHARELGIEGRVVFAGPQREVLPWYGMADAFILPTLYDPFPNAALEAWACGLPVLTSTGCGAQEAVIEDVNGWVRAPTDVDGFADAMERAQVALRADAAGLRTAARAAALPYSLEALGAALLDLYRGLTRS